MSCAKNTATVRDAARLLRAEGTTLVPSKFLHADIEVVVSLYGSVPEVYSKACGVPAESSSFGGLW